MSPRLPCVRISGARACAVRGYSCPNFLLREIKNVDNTKISSSKIITRFNGSGLKVISPLVDITNFITIDYCRPLHVFDFDKVEGNIEIRYSIHGEKFEGLDEKTYTLDDGMILICDEKKIISLAGIMGGKSSACDETTRNILLESAYFCPDINLLLVVLPAGGPPTKG